MGVFYLTPVSIPLLAKFLLSLIITIYIIFYIPKNKTVNWFLGYLIGYTFLDLFAFWGQTLNSDLANLSLPLQYLSSFVMSFSFLQFSYFFKEEVFKIEQHRVQNVLGFFALLCSIITFYIISVRGYDELGIIKVFAIYPAVCLIWATIVFFRKYLISRKARSSLKNAYLSFFIISTLAIVISFSVVFDALRIITPVQNMIIYFILNLVIISLLTVNFINYLAEKTTVLVKLIGISLVLFITVIGLQGFIVIPGFEQEANIQSSLLSKAELQMIHNQAMPYAWFLIGSIFMIVGIFPLFYNRSLLTPLKTLLDGVDELNAGNLNVNIPVAFQDEIGAVTRHFNIMAKNLRKANEELKEYAENLEDKIASRTQQLRSKTELLEKQTLQLEEMDQFRSKLFMDISHELRTPITLISGPLQKLLEQESLSDKASKQILMSLRNSNRLATLVEQIIDLNRLETNQLVLHAKPVDICEQLNYLVSSFESLLDFKNLEFESSIPKKQITLNLDLDKFEKIITNLITNAAKFTPEGGLISITLTDDEQSVYIKVTDTGVGIDPNKIDNIFDRYQTSATYSDEYKQGLGVGLSITKEYVQLHDGEISVESNQGSGSTFSLHFKKNNTVTALQKDIKPNFTVANIDVIDNKTSNSSNQLSKPSKKGLIFVVEDNSDMSEYISEILITDGYSVSTAVNGEEALSLLKQTTPDLIISDIMMPVMDGMVFLEHLKQLENHRNTPTIFLSARSDLEGRLQSFRLGVNDYLVKPFNTEELLCRIANLIKFCNVRKKASIEISEENSLSIDQTLINKLTELVEMQLSNSKFNVEDLAADISMSRSTLYREIKRITGFSAASFVKEIRLQKAKQKLESGLVKSLSELSFEVGFSTPAYFNKTYKDRFGKKPKEYLE